MSIFLLDKAQCISKKNCHDPIRPRGDPITRARIIPNCRPTSDLSRLIGSNPLTRGPGAARSNETKSTHGMGREDRKAHLVGVVELVVHEARDDAGLADGLVAEED
jgi:hypothetical protein